MSSSTPEDTQSVTEVEYSTKPKEFSPIDEVWQLFTLTPIITDEEKLEFQEKEYIVEDQARELVTPSVRNLFNHSFSQKKHNCVKRNYLIRCTFCKTYISSLRKVNCNVDELKDHILKYHEDSYAQKLNKVIKSKKERIHTLNAPPGQTQKKQCFKKSKTQKELNQDILQMIARYFLNTHTPFAAIEDEEMVNIMHMMGYYGTPPKTKAMRKLLVSQFMANRINLKSELAKVDSLNVETDCWLSISGEWFALGLISYGLWVETDNGGYYEKRERVLFLHKLTENQTGIYIASIIAHHLEFMGGIEKVKVLVADSASVNQRVTDDLYSLIREKTGGRSQFKGMVRCLAHIVALSAAAFIRTLRLQTAGTVKLTNENLIWIDENFEFNFDDLKRTTTAEDATTDSAHSESLSNEMPMFFELKVGDLLSKLRALTLKIKQGSLMDDFVKFQRESGSLRPLKLILDVHTRWNSLLPVLKRYYQLKQYINPYLESRARKFSFSERISIDEWTLIKSLICLLDKFDIYTQQVCSAATSTLSYTYPLLFQTKKCYELISNNGDLPVVFKTAADAALAQIDKYLDLNSANDAYYLSGLLDPRIKDAILRLTNKMDKLEELKAEISKEARVTIASQKFRDLETKRVTEVRARTDSSSSVGNSRSSVKRSSALQQQILQCDILESILQTVEGTNPIDDGAQEEDHEKEDEDLLGTIDDRVEQLLNLKIEEEIDLYFKSPREKTNRNNSNERLYQYHPLSYWNNEFYRQEYPLLAAVAKDYAVQSTGSVGCERGFSNLRDIYGVRRNSLNHLSMTMLACLTLDNKEEDFNKTVRDRVLIREHAVKESKLQGLDLTEDPLDTLDPYVKRQKPSIGELDVTTRRLDSVSEIIAKDPTEEDREIMASIVISTSSEQSLRESIESELRYAYDELDDTDEDDENKEKSGENLEEAIDVC